MRLKITYNAPVTLTFVIVAFVATLLGVLTGGLSTEALFMTYHSALSSPLTYVRFITHVFGHANWDHFIVNAAYILLLGPMLEEKYGSKEILAVVLITAVSTGVINYIFFADKALCGASGVVFACILLASFTNFGQGEIPLTFVLIAVIYIGQQVIDGIFIDNNISNMAHIVGGIVGTIIGYNLNRIEEGLD